ncbi:hypothetical protein FGIG_09455 [Fasciola gigantica]|uniref:ZMYM2-like/QRICH1 C-terminal domain-containing protein n=1 Tax=Fasciola gigantica TaxID=46835 RepID=A0A504YVG4_FASGI|nr:hypothetical protein FGIG_09455 [Fasciola gigantica]
MIDSDGFANSLEQPTGMVESRSFGLENAQVTSPILIKPLKNITSTSYLNTLTDVTESGVTDTFRTMDANTTLLLDGEDDALSAAMQAITEADRFNSDLMGSDPVAHHPNLVDHITLSSSQIEGGGREDSAGRVETKTISDFQAAEKFGVKTVTIKSSSTPGCFTSSPKLVSSTSTDGTHSCCSSNPGLLDSSLDATGAFLAHETDPSQGTPCLVRESVAILSKKPSLSHEENFLHSNWRPILRPIFERVLIERLWQCGELGASKPRALLLSMWFFISRNFGIGCRTEHARLVLGNLQVQTDLKTDSNYLVLVSLNGRDPRKSTSASRLVTSHPKHPDARIPARKDCVDRCPVHLFELFCSRRPASAHGLNTPLYLQPDRTSLTHRSDSGSSAWFTPHALGKNRIGSMLNAALQNLGMPVRRQVNLVRFCDALASAALTPAGGQTGSRLIQLMSDSHMDAISLDRELTCCAEHVVDQACITGTALHEMLTHACERSGGSSTVTGVGSDSRLARPTEPLSRVQFVPIRPAHVEPNNTPLTSTGSMQMVVSIPESLFTEESVSSFLSNPKEPGRSPISPLLKSVLDEPGPNFRTSGDNAAAFAKTIEQNVRQKQQPQQTSKRQELFEPNLLCSLDNQSDRLCSVTHQTTDLQQAPDDTQLSLQRTPTACSSAQGYLNPNEQAATVHMSTTPSSSMLITDPLPTTSILVPDHQSVVSYLPASESPCITVVNSVGSNMENTSHQISTVTSRVQPCSLTVNDQLVNLSHILEPSQRIPVTLLPAPNSTVLSGSSTAPAPSCASISPVIIPTQHDDIQIECRKHNLLAHTRSVPLELRELLDVVLTVAQFVPSQTPALIRDKLELSVSNASGSSSSSSSRVLRPPVGLVTQLLWRARALDDRGPWILTFTMWWLMQHYFGIGSRSHHVRLRWSHLRLVTGVLDPITNRLCDALEYMGPVEYTTVKAFALLESTGKDSTPVRRVYPSSGWAEAEIHVASALATDAPNSRPRIRPLDTGPDVPGLMDREGPDFVSLYKTFSAHRPASSCLPDSPFYIQPLHFKPAQWRYSVATSWFGQDALGKNRIGALMRNIVDKVVRVSLVRVAPAATAAARQSCLDVIRRAVLAMPVPTQSIAAADIGADLVNRRQLLVGRLADLLGLNMAAVIESGWLDQLNAKTAWISRPLSMDPVTGHYGRQIEIKSPGLSSPANTTATISTQQLQPQSRSQPSSLLQLVTEPPSAVLIHQPLFDADNRSQTATTTQVVLLTTNKLTSANNTSVQSVMMPSTLVSNQTGLFLVPTTPAPGTIPFGITHPNSSVSSGPFLLSGEAPVQEIQTATALITGSNISPLKPNTLSNGPISSCLTQPVAYVARTAHHGPVNLLVFTPNPVNAISSVVSDTAQLLSFHDPTRACSANSVLVPVSGGTPILYDLTHKPSLGCNLSRCVTATPSSLSSTSSITSATLFLGGQPVTSVTHPTPLYEDDRRTQSTAQHLVKLERCSPLQQNHCQSQQCGVYVPHTENTNRSISVSQSDQSLNPSVVTTSTPVLLCTPNSVCVSIPGGTVLQSHTFPLDTHVLRTAHTDAGCGPVYPVSADATDPLIKTSTYYSLTNSGTRYIIPSPSSSLLPGKPTPMFGPRPSDLNLALDADGKSATRTPTTIAATTKSSTEAAATVTTTNIALTTTESMQTVTVVSSAVAYLHSSSEYGPSSAVWCDNSSKHTPSLLPLDEMICHSISPEPEPKQLITLQDVIDQAWTTHYRDFPNYVDQLIRSGLLSTATPWCLNFTAWFINSVAFEVENRTEHVNLLWGDFRLCHTADSRAEYLYFVNRVTHRTYYLAASNPPLYGLDHEPKNEAKSAKSPEPIHCPCPVAVFKALRDHRPITCLDPYSKLYLQPRISDLFNRKKPHTAVPTGRDWFFERPWGKNRVGSLLTEATKLAGLPMICLRKHRARAAWPNSVESPNNNLPTTGDLLSVELGPDASITTDGQNTTVSTVQLVVNADHSTVKRRKTSPSRPVTYTLFPDRRTSLFPEDTPGVTIPLPSSSTILRQSSTSCLSTDK